VHVVAATSSADTTASGQMGIRSPMSDESSLRGTHERTCIIVNKLTDPQTGEASGNPEAAMCVRKSSARRVLQFTPFNVASYVLHRPASRVIHRLQLYLHFGFSFKNILKFLSEGNGHLSERGTASSSRQCLVTEHFLSLAANSAEAEKDTPRSRFKLRRIRRLMG
jgi:hypothetical protein